MKTLALILRTKLGCVLKAYKFFRPVFRYFAGNMCLFRNKLKCTEFGPILVNLFLQSNDSQPGVVFSLRGHLVVSGDIFGCHNWEGSAIGLQWEEARNAAEYLTMHMTIGCRPPHSKDISDPRFPEY